MEDIKIRFESESGWKSEKTSSGEDSFKALENALWLVFDGHKPNLLDGDIITILPIEKEKSD
jgi:hypothetical protein